MRNPSAVATAIKQHVPILSARANKPWISSRTLELLRRRREARTNGNWNLEKQLRSDVKKSAKDDRSKWLEDLVSSGDWKSVKQLRKGRHVKQGRLRNAEGVLVSSELRAETLAEHLEKIQWRVRPATLVPGTKAPLEEPLDVNWCDFSYAELRKSLNKWHMAKLPNLMIFPSRRSRLWQWNRIQLCSGFLICAIIACKMG